MKFTIFKSAIIMAFTLFLSSCVTQKKYQALQQELKTATETLHACNEQKALCQSDLSACRASLNGKQDQYNLLNAQLEDCKTQRDKQLTQVGDLTVLSKSANDNINQTLAQLENKDRYIQMLLAAKTKADSINLALAVNLKGVLQQGLDDKDVEIKVDKTVVFINLSDKMLYNSGSYTLTARAKEVLGKIATIVASRPEVDVMVEGYTDNKSIKTACIDDNWDLSVKRATSVVRVLQNDYKIDPNKLIAAGRGQYNTLTSNDTEEGRSTNRRTRIIIMPKLDQFYDLLDPSKAATK
ncbi:MAG: OmpA family protein [Chitinophagales bacterium]